MTQDRIEIRYPRSASAIGLVVFLGALWLWADFGFFHTLNYKQPVEQRGGILYWLVLAPILLTLAMTVKTVVAPSVIFIADRQGLALGRGVFINRLQRIPWSKVREIRVDKFGAHTDRGAPDLGIRLTFDPDVQLSRVGFPTSRRTDMHSWEIRNSVFTETVQTVANRLSALQAAA